jgi:pimeloyl-ACP methyl ester carboxylesterase
MKRISRGACWKGGLTEVANKDFRCQLIEIPDAAHDLPNENPAGFIRALRAYLTEVPNAK